MFQFPLGYSYSHSIGRTVSAHSIALYGSAGGSFMSDTSPLPTTPALFFQFLQLSQLTGATFQLPLLQAKHTEELNNFSIYMHGGIRCHSNTVRHSRKCRPRTTQRRTNVLRLDSRSRRAFRPLQLVITVRIKQEKFKCFHARQVRFLLQV